MRRIFSTPICYYLLILLVLLLPAHSQERQSSNDRPVATFSILGFDPETGMVGGMDKIAAIDDHIMKVMFL